MKALSCRRRLSVLLVLLLAASDRDTRYPGDAGISRSPGELTRFRPAPTLQMPLVHPGAGVPSLPRSSPSGPVARPREKGVSRLIYRSAHHPDPLRDSAVGAGVSVPAHPASVVPVTPPVPGRPHTLAPDAGVPVPGPGKPAAPQGPPGGMYDQGIPAAFLSYNLSGARNQVNEDGMHQLQRSLYGSLAYGADLGPWRLRSSTSYSAERDSGGSDGYDDDDNSYQEWLQGDTYLQRDIQALHSEFSAGDLSSDGDIFDTVSFRGVTLGTSEAMLPADQRQADPVITGVARTNARVTVRQRGTIIWQAWVPPGPFEIPVPGTSGNSGKLLISIKEADGTTHNYTHSYASLALMQPAGQRRYTWLAGRYRDNGMTTGSGNALFTQGTLMAGLSGERTLYGGLLYAGNYGAVVTGLAQSMGSWGVLATDVTVSRAELPPAGSVTGTRLKATYSRAWEDSGTQLSLTVTQYPTTGYYSFTDFNNAGYALSDTAMPWDSARPSQDWQANISQSVDSLGMLSLNATHETFHNSSEVNNQLSLSVSTMVRQVSLGVNYNINYEQDEDGTWQKNRMLSLNLSVPFSLFSHAGSDRGPDASYSYSLSTPGEATHTVSLDGELSPRWGYDASESWGARGENNSGNADLYTRSGVTSGSLGYNYGNGQRGMTYGLSGGLLATGEGVVQTPDVSNGAILVRVPHQAGVRIAGSDETTNSQGLAVVSSVVPYRENTVSLDSSTLPAGMAVPDAVTLWPTQGAIVAADFMPKAGGGLVRSGE